MRYVECAMGNSGYTTGETVVTSGRTRRRRSVRRSKGSESIGRTGSAAGLRRSDATSTNRHERTVGSGASRVAARVSAKEGANFGG